MVEFLTSKFTQWTTQVIWVKMSGCGIGGVKWCSDGCESYVVRLYVTEEHVRQHRCCLWQGQQMDPVWETMNMDHGGT